MYYKEFIFTTAKNGCLEMLVRRGSKIMAQQYGGERTVL